MITILMLLGLIAPKAPTNVAQISTCQWPNKCAVEAPVVAQIQPCIWPNKCMVETPVQG